MKKLSFILAIALCITLFPFSSFASASTISVKLSNYFGNTSNISFTTTGSYKLANGNNRLDGANRFIVANNVASSGWTRSTTAIVVNYLAFADALAATPLAYKNDAPILLTRPNGLTPETKTKLQQLGVQNVIIIGGAGSVSTTVENELRAVSPNVTRIGGADRYEVSKNIAAHFGNSNTAILANGLVFADALSIAPYAARNGFPILLAAKDRLPDRTREALQGKQNTLVIGGEGSVGAGVYGQLPAPSRIGGSDRYEVSANIVRQLNLPASTAFVSTGLTFADALTGSVLAAKQNAPILLTRPTNIPTPIQTVISEKSISNFTILGGTASVSDSAVSSLPNEVWIQSGEGYSVKVENGRLALYKGSDRLKDFGTTPFTLVPNSYGAEHQIRLNNRASYIGKMDFNLENGAYVRPVNRDIPFEDYLKGVVPREMPASWNLEALKAQAVAARTYSIDDVGKVVPDTQSYQVYGGFTWGSGLPEFRYENRTNQAVNETAGQVLRYGGSLVSTVFSSSNGGNTESNSNEWGTSQVAYLPAKPDSFDPQNPWGISLKKTQIDLTGKSLVNPGHWWWSVTEVDNALLTGLKNHLKNNAYPNSEIKVVNVNDFVIQDGRTSGGRSLNATMKLDIIVKDSAGFKCVGGPCNGSNEIEIVHVDLPLTVKSYRSLFGGEIFKSTLLDATEIGSDYIKIKGRGFGHGVGMSQFGAKARGEAGHSYVDILNFYYPGATLGQ